MTINLSFAELNEYIKTHYDKDLNFSRESEKVLRVSYGQRVFFKTVHVPVCVSIKKVDADAITISFNGGLGIDMAAKGVMAFIKARMPQISNILIPEKDHHIRIELSRMNQTKAIVKAMTLEDIEILDNSILLSASLK